MTSALKTYKVALLNVMKGDILSEHDGTRNLIYKAFCLFQAKIAFFHASMVVTYYTRLFRTRADRHNSILMSLLLLVAESMTNSSHSTLC